MVVAQAKLALERRDDMGSDLSANLKAALAAALLLLLVGCSGAAEKAAEELAPEDPPLDPPADPPAPPPPPGADPTASLSAASTLIDSGTSTTLTWSSSNATGCTASGGWSGAKGTSGSEPVGPLTAAATFTLTCSGSGSNAVAMITVNVNGTMNVSWVAPTENVDGSPLGDLARYKIYYGDQSRNYLGSVDVTDPNATSFDLTLASGDYFVAMTAWDGDDNESAYSNEVLKTVN